MTTEDIIKIGNVYQVETQKGLSYVQYTHEHQDDKAFSRNSLIRVLDGFYSEPLSKKDIYELVKKTHRFQKFCYLEKGIKDKELVYIENFPIPDFAQSFPVFKQSMSLSKKQKDPEENIWGLWDGKSFRKVGKLSLEEQIRYPLDGVCDITALKHYIETGRMGKILLC